MSKLKEKKYTVLYKLSKYIFIFIIGFSIMLPFVFVGASGIGSGVSISTGIENPLGDKINDIPSLIEQIVEIVLVVGIPIIALAIIYTGFLFIKAQGAPEEINKAKQALLYTLIGAILLLGAFVISKAIVKTVDEIKSDA
ncbi:TPA: hypothetical protein DIC38_02145 [Candidatus Nomurabacteria bacterium]|nr:MAG: hypothetical protein O210_OD1C00001G0301 [Parcubacteria bacterium RAAC4_OD1_1]HCY26458.1 hypothetical protein [Candidatus Nomurabacteria bacterium]